ncbi:MAG TPA: RtcB family protein [Candidatus Nitrosopolaris sp.]|nr:RtcB family protein [Candidatus Nitrosopolaris sp.]
MYYRSSTLPGVQKHVIVLIDGHEGYGFPVGGVAAMDLDQEMGSGVEGNGIISRGGVGIPPDPVQITILIYCGSRGLGHQVCSDYLRVAKTAL